MGCYGGWREEVIESQQKKRCNILFLFWNKGMLSIRSYKILVSLTILLQLWLHCSWISQNMDYTIWYFQTKIELFVIASSVQNIPIICPCTLETDIQNMDYQNIICILWCTDNLDSTSSHAVECISKTISMLLFGDLTGSLGLN